MAPFLLSSMRRQACCWRGRLASRAQGLCHPLILLSTPVTYAPSLCPHPTDGGALLRLKPGSNPYSKVRLKAPRAHPSSYAALPPHHQKKHASDQHNVKCPLPFTERSASSRSPTCATTSSISMACSARIRYEPQRLSRPRTKIEQSVAHCHHAPPPIHTPRPHPPATQTCVNIFIEYMDAGSLSDLINRTSVIVGLLCRRPILELKPRINFSIVQPSRNLQHIPLPVHQSTSMSPTMSPSTSPPASSVVSTSSTRN